MSNIPIFERVNVDNNKNQENDNILGKLKHLLTLTPSFYFLNSDFAIIIKKY